MLYLAIEMLCLAIAMLYNTNTRVIELTLGVLTILNFIGACSTKVYLIFVDPKSKISEKSDQN